MDNLQAYKNTLSADPDKFGPLMAQVFQEWRQNPDISCGMFQGILEKHFGGPQSEGLRQAVQIALQLADEKSTNGYHHHHHNREVVALTLALLIRHKELALTPALGTDLVWLTVAAAAIHDYGHDGTSNRIDGKVAPMHLEKHSLALAKPALMEAGLSEGDWLKLSMIVLTTDITPTVAPSPSAQLKDIFGFHSGTRSEPDMIDPIFLPLIYDRELAHCAQIVGDSDLAISAALSPEMTQMNSASLAVETKGAVPFTPQSLQGYLNFVCKGFPASPAGQVLLTPGLERSKLIASRDVANDVRYEIR